MFFVSAEGKNPDIVEALLRARQHSARDLHVLTNRTKSELQEAATRLSDVNVNIFELEHKDGYLATNSLIMDAVIVARAYEELDRHDDEIPPSIDDLRLSDGSISTWIEQADCFAKKAASCDGMIVLHSAALKPVATDLESKLAEAALLYCQVADLRSFAHGRHSWLVPGVKKNTILALVDPSTERLWNATRALIPSDVETLTLNIGGSSPRDVLAALVAELKLVSLIAHFLGRDPAKPVIGEFSRSLYYIDLAGLVQEPLHKPNAAELSKFGVLGAHWPSITRDVPMQRMAAAARETLTNRVFGAVVFDYDGTISSSNRRDLPPPQAIYDGLQAKLVLRKADLVLSAFEQEKLLKSVARRKREFIPKTHSEGTRAGKLLDAIGNFCREKTFQPTAPYAPGVTGVRFSQSELNKIRSDRASNSASSSILRKVLSESVAENLLVTRESAASGSRESGTVFYMNRTLCAHYGLPLQYGGWQDISVQDAIEWMERGRITKQLSWG